MMGMAVFMVGLLATLEALGGLFVIVGGLG